MLYPKCDYINVANRSKCINPVELVTTANAANEKKIWLNNAAEAIFANPSYEYKNDLLTQVATQRPAFETFRHTVETEMLPQNESDEIVKAILIARLDETIASTRLAAAILANDTIAAQEAVENIYGHPGKKQVENAKKRYSYLSSKESKDAPELGLFTAEERKALQAIKLDASMIERFFVKALDAYGIDSWKVEVSDKYTAIDVRDKNADGISVVGIPADRVVDGLKLIELTRHEIEYHLRGSENCRNLISEMLDEDSPLRPFIPILAKSDNEWLYEGVAKYNDAIIGGDHGIPTPYATLACNMALNSYTFNQITVALFRLMKNESMPLPNNELLEELYKTVYRVIRGTTNTRKGGFCFTKDYIYLDGYMAVKDGLDARYYDFASMKLCELQSIGRYSRLTPKYPLNPSVILNIKAELLSL